MIDEALQMPTVKLSNNKSFTAKQGEILLDCAKSHGLVLEHSCRTGRCGACKARVLSGITSVELPETALSEQDAESGYILTCCRGALDDLVLDVTDLGRLAAIEARTLPCRIDSLLKLSADVLAVTLRMPPGNRFQFLAGQHINVIGEGGIRRSYSIANAPREDGKLELHIRSVAGGVMSSYWFERAQVNDLLRIEGPLGTFCLRDTGNRNLVFIATGTGIAPVKAMLEELVTTSVVGQERKILIYWGGRELDDIYLQLETGDLQCEFIPVLSRPGTGWNGRTGYVQAALLADEVHLDDTTVYACGSEEMISSARQLLIESGLSAVNFYSDAFVSSD